MRNTLTDKNSNNPCVITWKAIRNDFVAAHPWKWRTVLFAVKSLFFSDFLHCYLRFTYFSVSPLDVYLFAYLTLIFATFFDVSHHFAERLEATH